MTVTASPPADEKTVILGWLEAGMFVLLIGTLGVIYTIGQAQGSHAVAFLLSSMLLSGLVLTVLTGGGKAALSIALAPLTWVTGFSNILLETIYFVTMQWVMPAEASLLIRVSIPISLGLGIVLFGRRPTWIAWLGAAIVMSGIGLLVSRFDLVRQWPGLVCAVLVAICFVTRGYASEAHPWNRSARTLKEKLRVTGLITLVTALGGFVLVGATIAAVDVGLLAPTPLLPQPADLVHPPTLWLALLVGGAVFTALNFLAFSAVVKIGTENFIAASAFMPPATYLVQLLAASAGLVAVKPFDWGLLPAMALAVAGVFVVIAGARRR